MKLAKYLAHNIFLLVNSIIYSKSIMKTHNFKYKTVKKIVFFYNHFIINYLINVFITYSKS